MSARNRHRFHREAKAASEIDSPNVVRVLSVGETSDERPFIVMELVSGASLTNWLAETTVNGQIGKGSINESVRLLIQVCRGVQAVHDAGLVHRDIKPGNVFVDAVNRIAKLGDFGLARILNDDTVTLTRVAELAGTPAYMSPEQSQANGAVDARSDVYSLGATLYYVLTGQAPFQGSSIAVLKQAAEVEPLRPRQLNESVSRDLETICNKALSKLPEFRYSSASEMADDLQRFVNGEPIQARPIPVWRRLIMWSNRNRALACSLSLLLISLVLGAAMTTAMSIRSSQSADEARRYAASLEQSRTRMRESVSRFQKRVFSQQAMHWQMPESFRAEMFADVISYLDEFAEFETPGNTDASQKDELTDDYLLVAQTALDVNRPSDARVASDRALMRIGKISSQENVSDDNYLLRFRAAQLGYLARTPVTKFYQLKNLRLNLDERQRLALECQQAIQNAAANSDDERWKLRNLEAQFLVAGTVGEPDNADLVRAQNLFSRMKQLLETGMDREAQLDVLGTAIRSGWFLSANLPNSEAQEILQQNIALIEAMRECLRQLSQSLVESDWLKATNYARLAVLKEADCNLPGAISAATEARHAFKKAVLMRPQNRIWTNDLVCLHLLLGDWLRDQGELKLATETYYDVMMHNVRLSKSYPDDIELQKRSIKILVKMAEICQERKLHDHAQRNFYMAARDCQLILLLEEHRDWAFRTRLWLVFKTLEQLSLAPNEEILTELTKNENAGIENWREDYGLDTSLMRGVLDGSQKPERPNYLESKQITADILAGW